MGIGQQAEGTGVHPSLPAQSAWGLDAQGLAQRQGALAGGQLQAQAPGGALFEQARSLACRGRRLGRPPYLPVLVAGDLRSHPDRLPPPGRRLGTFVAGEGPQHPPPQALGLGQGLPSPGQHQLRPANPAP